MGSVRRGLRNVARGRVRSGLAAAVLALATGVLVATLQIGRATEAQASRLEREAATLIQVNPRGALGGGPERGFPEGAVRGIASLPGVEWVEAYRRWLFQDPSRPFQMSAINGVAPGSSLRPMALGGYLGILPRLVAGRALRPTDAGEPVAVVGRVFARQYQVSLGEEFTIPASTLRGNAPLRPSALRARVVGIVSSGVVFPDNQVFVPLALAQEVLGRPGEVTNLWVRARSARQVPEAEEGLRRLLGERADVLSVREPASRLVDSLEGARGASLLASLVSVLAGALVAFFTMALVVRERRREVGVLKALGASTRSVAAQFLAEALALGFLGAAVGVGLAALGADRLANALVSAPGGLEDPVRLSAGVALAGLVVGMAAAALGSLLPVRRAARTQPAEVIRSL